MYKGIGRGTEYDKGIDVYTSIKAIEITNYNSRPSSGNTLFNSIIFMII